MILLSILILSLPTLYEIHNEKKGEPLKMKWLSMLVRVVIAAGSVWVAAVFKNDNLLLDLIKCGLLAFAIFFLFFDYAINLILGRKPWYSYLGKSPLDKLWSSWDWRWRMAIRGVVFCIALIWFLNK